VPDPSFRDHCLLFGKDLRTEPGIASPAFLTRSWCACRVSGLWHPGRDHARGECVAGRDAGAGEVSGLQGLAAGREGGPVRASPFFFLTSTRPAMLNHMVSSLNQPDSGNISAGHPIPVRS
jgi:hypothetical protein